MGLRIPIAEGDSWLGALLLVFVPALVALASFFSWIMLINDLRIPFYLYYGRTVFLIYIDRSLDKTIWILSSILTLVLVAARPISQSISFRLSILFPWVGIAVGAVAMLGVGQGMPIAGPLATFAGCVVNPVERQRRARDS